MLNGHTVQTVFSIKNHCSGKIRLKCSKLFLMSISYVDKSCTANRKHKYEKTISNVTFCPCFIGHDRVLLHSMFDSFTRKILEMPEDLYRSAI